MDSTQTTSIINIKLPFPSSKAPTWGEYNSWRNSIIGQLRVHRLHRFVTIAPDLHQYKDNESYQKDIAISDSLGRWLYGQLTKNDQARDIISSSMTADDEVWHVAVIMKRLDDAFGRNKSAYENNLLEKICTFELKPGETPRETCNRLTILKNDFKSFMKEPEQLLDKIFAFFFLRAMIMEPAYNETAKQLQASNLSIDEVLSQFRELDHIPTSTQSPEGRALAVRTKCFPHVQGCHHCGGANHCTNCCRTKQQGLPQTDRGRRLRENWFASKLQQQQQHQQQQQQQQQQPPPPQQQQQPPTRSGHGLLAVTNYPNQLVLDSGAYLTQVPNVNNKQIPSYLQCILPPQKGESSTTTATSERIPTAGSAIINFSNTIPH